MHEKLSTLNLAMTTYIFQRGDPDGGDGVSESHGEAEDL